MRILAERSTRIAGAGLVLAALGACSGAPPMPPPRFAGAGASAPRRGGTLTFSIIDDVRNLDPAIAFDEYSMYAEHLVFETLLDYAPATAPDPLALVPALAESWSASPDGLVYTFVLRPGLTFADGSPLGAGDFVYAFDRVLDPAVNSSGAQFYTGIAGAEERLAGRSAHASGLVAADERTLEITLAKRDASFPLLMALPFATPMSRAHVEAQGPRIRDHPLATGPFVLVEWKEGEALRFARNPRYWNPERPYLDGIVMRVQMSQSVLTLAFLKGDLDTMERPSSDDYLRFARTPEWQPYLAKVPLMNVYGELLNLRTKPFDDKRVRQAMNYAVDKDDIVRLFNGRAVVSHGPLPPRMPGYDPTLPAYPHDPARARALLAEAGYPHGFEVTYTTTAEENAQRIAQSIQADLAEVGVKVNIQIVTFPAYLTACGRLELPFAYTAWLMDFPDPWDFLEVKFHSRMIAEENANNDTGYVNPEVDRLLDEARQELDRERRLELYRRVERIVHDDCPWVFEYHRLMAEVRQPYVKGYVAHPVWMRSYRDAWLDLPRREVR